MYRAAELWHDGKPKSSDLCESSFVSGPLSDSRLHAEDTCYILYSYISWLSYVVFFPLSIFEKKKTYADTFAKLALEAGNRLLQFNE